MVMNRDHENDMQDQWHGMGDWHGMRVPPSYASAG